MYRECTGYIVKCHDIHGLMDLLGTGDNSLSYMHNGLELNTALSTYHNPGMIQA